MKGMNGALVLMVGVCGASCGKTSHLDREALLDPRTCQECHPDHYREWSGSMHAYAAKDPLFLAMNARGQRETDGALGDFCIQCHAPMAVLEGATTDGLNIETLPESLQGITCYFCHSAKAVDEEHNNGLVIADDNIMRGSFSDPIDNDAHASAWSPLHDRTRTESAALCGSCHDIVTPNGVELERTYLEWKGSVYSHEDASVRLTCGQCHMDGRDGVAANVPGAPGRRVHSHMWPGVDLALHEDFPEKSAQRDAVESLLDTTLGATLCVYPDAAGALIEVTLENITAGHDWPSGAAQDRRAWLELSASGEGQSLLAFGGDAPDNPIEYQDDLGWVLRDWLYDEQGESTHMFWETASIESALLPPPTTSDPSDPAYYDTHVTRTFVVDSMPDHVDMAVHLRAVGYDVIDDLIASGDLDSAWRDAIPTYDMASTRLEWNEGDPVCVP